jgi:hypothetical protein
MKKTMRFPTLLICFLFALQSAQAQSLTEADREALLESLEKLKESADSRIASKHGVAMTAFRRAMESDDAAMELYLNCIEKVNFQDRERKAADFRDWKRREADRLSDPGIRPALRFQLRWLVLTLRASSEKIERENLAAEAQAIVDAIFLNPQRLKNQAGLLSESVTSSIFARAYDINRVNVQNWSLSPVALDQIYNEILLPPYRSPGRLDALRSGWLKRIQQEGKKVEFWGGERRAGRAAGGPTQQEYVRFMQETAPALQWQMELELFQYGDQSGAATRMLALLEKNLAHPSAREWGNQFRALLKPAVATTELGRPE